MICPVCGETMTQVNSRHYECQCGNWGFKKYGKIKFRSETEDPETWDDDYEVVYGDEEIPSCCIGCNPAYPACKSSCNLFDED